MSKQSLKEAALALFAEKGYDGTALSEIAKREGIKTPSIYAHFSSKEALYMAVYRDAIQSELNSFKEASAENHRSQIDLLKSMFYKATDFEKNPERKRFFLRAIYYPPVDLKKEMLEEISNYEALTYETLSETLKLGLSSEQARKQWLHIFYALVDGLSMEHELYETEEFELRRASAFEVLKILLDRE